METHLPVNKRKLLSHSEANEPDRKGPERVRLLYIRIKDLSSLPQNPVGFGGGVGVGENMRVGQRSAQGEGGIIRATSLGWT